MAKSYNGLNAYKIELAEIGICPQCGRRLSLCEHATEQQRTEWRIQDAELLEEIEQQRILDNLTPDAQAEKFGWYDVPEIKDGVSSPAWFEAQPEVEF